MPQLSIGERIKFLLDTNGGSIRKFARMLDVSDTNIRNYIERGTKPSSDALEKLMQNIPHLNSAWLLTGEGEPFLSDIPAISTTTQTGDFNQAGSSNTQKVKVDKGQPQQELAAALAACQRELEVTRALVAAKDETITLLRATYNRPN